MLIINADDWGLDGEATDRILSCYRAGGLTAASAMLFMRDSARAAGLALEHGLDAGLHLNFTQRFDSDHAPGRLLSSQAKTASFLRRNRYCPVLYNPFLIKDFEYAYHAQYEEFLRLYGREPTHIDGHHHMHLCSNVLFSGLIPKGSVVRRSFSFSPGEKGVINRSYRAIVDRWLGRSYRCTEYFFSVSPLQGPERLRRIVELSMAHSVELMVHPAREAEFDYLSSNEYLDLVRSYRTDSFSSL